MLSIRNGLKSIWRAPAKAILFMVLLAVLTGVLSLGLSIHYAVSDYLSDCEEYFRTIVNLEYVGPNYGSDWVYDESVRTLLETMPPEQLADLDGVLSWESNRSALGVMSGVRRTDGNVADKDSAVIVVSGLLWDDHTVGYQGWISEVLYSHDTDIEGKTVYISPYGIEGLTDLGGLDRSQTRTYVFSGKFISGMSSYLWFMPQSVTLMDGDQEIVIPSCEPVIGDKLAEDSIYRSSALASARLRDSVRIQMTEHLDDYLPFQQQELVLQDGRMFTADEAGEPVCVISQWLSGITGLSIGDKLPLELYYNAGNGIYSMVDLMNVPDLTCEYEIVGIINNSEGYTDRVLIPYGDVYTPDPVPTGSTVAQYRLENDKAEAFYEQASAMLPDGLRLTVYNQGYQITAEPFREMLLISNVFLVVCGLVSVAVMALFAYLFVFRQRETANTMRAIGATDGHIYRYFTAAVCSVILPAALIGIALCSVLEQYVLSFVAAFTQQYLSVDLRYSNAALTIVKTLEFAPDTPDSLLVLAVLLMTLCAVMSCICFTAFALRRKQRKRASGRKVYRGKSSRMTGILKYSLLSVRRGSIRTVSVIVVIALIAVFLGQLTATEHSNRDQLEQVKENTVIRAYASNRTGLAMDNLLIPVQESQNLFNTGLTTADGSSMAVTYRVEGVSQTADGQEHSVPLTTVPSSSFAQETLMMQMSQEPMIVMTTSLRNHPDFYYSGMPETIWAEGYDERCLAGKDSGICVVPSTLLEGNLQLGCTLQVFTNELKSYSFKVVGAYVPWDDSRTIYMPLNYEHPVGRTDGITVSRNRDSGKEAVLDYDGTPVYVIRNNVEDCQAFLNVYEVYTSGKIVNEIQFAPGVENWMFFDVSDGVYAVVSDEYAEEHGLAYYDVLEFTSESGKVYSYMLAGTFRKVSSDVHDIYCIPPFTVPEVEFRDISDSYRAGQSTNSAVFTLKNTESLTAFRDALENGKYRMVGSEGSSRKPVIVIDDKDYISTVNGLERQITYTEALYRCLYILIALIGLVMSGLLVQSRKSELATMRGLGTPSARILVTFFTEQIILLTAGTVLGVVTWILLKQPVEPLYPVILLVFAVCWLTGSMTSILRMLRTNTMMLLSERED